MTTSESSSIANDARIGGKVQVVEKTQQAKKFKLPPRSFIDAFEKELLKEVRRQERDNDPRKPPSQMAFLRGRVTFLRRAFDAGVSDKRIIQIFNDNKIEISLHTLRAFWKANGLKRKEEAGTETNADSGQKASNKTGEGDGQSQTGAPKKNAGEIVSKTDGEERGVHNHGADKKNDGKGNEGTPKENQELGNNHLGLEGGESDKMTGKQENDGDTHDEGSNASFSSRSRERDY